MRIVLFTGKGGVGKTTTASATALRLADRGVKTLLLSTDSAHSLGDALRAELGNEPVEVAPSLWAVHIDTQQRFEVAWRDVQRFLLDLLARGGVDPITAEELTVLPGVEEVLALLAVRDLALNGQWDVLVVDCAPTAETLRLLALPEALGWYLQKVFPAHRRLARGMRPLAAIMGRGEVIPPDSIFDALLRLSDDLASVRELLADPAVTTVRLVLTPETVVAAEARRTFTALALYGYRVDLVIANRVFPRGRDAFRQGWVSAQQVQLAELRESFAGLPVHAELMSVDSVDGEYVLRMWLPLVERAAVDAARSGDDLVLTVAGHRRVITLPSVLRRCDVVGGELAERELRVRFRPNPSLWPKPDDDAERPSRRRGSSR